MKKLLSIFLIFVLLFGVVACNEGTSTEDPVVLPDESNPSACEHEWIEANCTTPKTCRLCKETKGTVLAHDFADATCTAPKTCKACNATEGKALGHTWANADCDTPKTCTVCNATEGEALGHTWVDATCTAPKTCSVCNATEGEALGHTWVDADCDTPKTCTVCGATEGEALGHDLGDATCTEPATCKREGCTHFEGEVAGHVWKNATCTEAKTCLTCGATEGEALGHNWANADCDTPKTCKVCGTTEGEALGHDWADADCDTPKTCKVCGATEGQALGHSGNWTVTVVPTEGNVWKKTRTCSVCGEVESVEIPAELSIPATPPAPIYPENTTTGGMKIKLVEGGKAQFTIVSSAEAYDDLARVLATQLRGQLGVTFKYVESASQATVTGKKIVIGKTPSVISPDISELSYLGLLFYYGASSIHITGHIEETIIAAVDRFGSIDFSPYISTGSDGKKLVSVPSGVFNFIANPTNYVNPNPTLFGTPLSEYTIIVPENMSATENFCMIQLIDEIGRYSGVYLSTKTPSEATGVNEIVFTNTESLATTDYAIKSENGCLYIPFPNYRIAKEMRTALHTLYLSNLSDDVDITVTPLVDPETRVEKSDDTDVRVMSSNIVCAGDANGIKDIAEPYGITWQERVAIVTKEIMIYLPDFVGFQEIQNGSANGIFADMFNEILNNTSSEYAFVTYAEIEADIPEILASGARHSSSPYWNPILYRKTVWQIEAKDVLYPENFDNAMHRWQWALFSKIEDPTQKYIVLNLHNPTRSGNLPAQLAAADIVNAKILELKELYPDIPIILTGDFNTELDTETYQRTIANTDVRCAYTLTDNCNDLGDLTGKETSTSKDDVIDHIMVSTDLLNVIACRKINGDYMALTSDHRPMFVDLSLKKNLIPSTL